MRVMIISIVGVLMAVGLVWAGPNAYGRLVVHGDPDMYPDIDPWGYGNEPCEQIPFPTSCDQLDPQAYESLYGLYWCLILAVFPEGNTPSFNYASFGLGDYQQDEVIVEFDGPCGPYGLAYIVYTPNWPGPNSGVQIYWEEDIFTADFQPICFLGAYVYSSPTEVPLAPHPSEPSIFWDWTDPEEGDPIYWFSTIGFGQPGFNLCHTEPTPVRSTTWGQIKATYR